MKQLNIRHLFMGELTPLKLGEMSISAGLFTSYHVQNDVEFTMTVLTVNDKNFASINILGLPVFFDLETETGNLTLVQDIETELVTASGYDYSDNIPSCTVTVFKQLEDFNNDIDDISEKINNTEIYDKYFAQVIDEFEKNKSSNNESINSTPKEVEEEFGDDVEEISLKHIEVFDDNEYFELDVEIPEVKELLDDVIDIDLEIDELKLMAQELLNEASHITKNGFTDYEDEDKELWYKEEDLYWETTTEEDEKYGLTNPKNHIDYIDKEVAKMDEKANNIADKQFEERLNNMLEFMLSQSSVGHEPTYTYNYTTKGKEDMFVDETGKFLVAGVDNHTKFSADNHIITLKVTRTSQETGETTSSIEESELMGDFTMDEVIAEVKKNSKYLRNIVAELYTMETKGGKVIWIAHPKSK